MRLSRMLLEGSDTHPEGVMVGLWVPVVAAGQLAQPGGEELTELHLTLAYLGKGLSRGLVSKLQGVCATCAALHPPLAGRVVGTGRFPPSDSSDGKEVIFARPEIPGLERFREELVRRLKAAGGPVRENFKYNPHITLAYVQPGAQLPVTTSQVPLRFHDLVFAIGPDRRLLPFGG
jgi:2'-5' RNA ligase